MIRELERRAWKENYVAPLFVSLRLYFGGVSLVRAIKDIDWHETSLELRELPVVHKYVAGLPFL